MATLKNKRKLAVMNKENQEDHPRNIQARNTNSPRSQEENITQVSEEIEGSVTKKLSQEFSKIESRILGTLSWLDEFLQNPQSRARSGLIPETSQKLSNENKGTNEDSSQIDPHSEVGVSLGHSPQEISPEETSYTARGVQEEIPYPSYMLTSFSDEIPYCSHGTSSRKQKKARSTSQPHFRSGNTPTSIEADQILLSLRNLASNRNSANFINYINRIYK